MLLSENGKIYDTTVIGGAAGLAINFFPHKLSFAFGYDSAKNDADGYESRQRNGIRCMHSSMALHLLSTLFLQSLLMTT